MNTVDTTHADYEVPTKIKVVSLAPTFRPTVESAVDAAHADCEVPMTIRITKPAPTSGLEDQRAAVDYAEVTGAAIYNEELNSTETVEPIEDATYGVISPASFDKDTLQRTLQIGADGGLRLASVHRTNPLATNAATGNEPIPPTIHESEYAEISHGGAEAIYDVPGTDTIYEEPLVTNAATGNEPIPPTIRE